MSVKDKVIVLLHDVSSAQRLVDMARLVYGLGFNVFLVSKVYGGAATSGVPEVSRLALKLGKQFAVLPNVKEAIFLLEPEKVFIVSREHGEPTDPKSIADKVASSQGKVLLVFGGTESSPGKNVVGLGEPVYIVGTDARIGAIGEAAIILYSLVLQHS